METKIRVGAVSYLNTKPLIYGFEQGCMSGDIELITDYPSKIAQKLINNEIDLALVPVAIIPQLKEHHIISDYCIGCTNEVASVSLFSDVPLNEIETILLDYQSKSSVGLLKILLKEYWKVSPLLINAEPNYEGAIKANVAGLVIGDRAFEQIHKNKYVYDLGAAWKLFTGLPFVFAAWISNKKLGDEFIEKFNKANAIGFEHLDDVIAQNPYNMYSLKKYYTENISYALDDEKRKGLNLYLQKLATI